MVAPLPTLANCLQIFSSLYVVYGGSELLCSPFLRGSPLKCCRDVLLSVHMCTLLRLPNWIASWAAAEMPFISANIIIVYQPREINRSSPHYVCTLPLLSVLLFGSICVPDVYIPSQLGYADLSVFCIGKTEFILWVQAGKSEGIQRLPQV